MCASNLLFYMELGGTVLRVIGGRDVCKCRMACCYENGQSEINRAPRCNESKMVGQFSKWIYTGYNLKYISVKFQNI